MSFLHWERWKKVWLIQCRKPVVYDFYSEKGKKEKLVWLNKRRRTQVVCDFNTENGEKEKQIVSLNIRRRKQNVCHFCTEIGRKKECERLKEEENKLFVTFTLIRLKTNITEQKKKKTSCLLLLRWECWKTSMME